MNVPAKNAAQPTPATIEDVLIRGDLSKLTEGQRTEYYLRVCKTLGLNPLTRPFDYLMLSGRLVLYAKRDAADQLRKINGISVEIVGQEHTDGLLIVHARAKDKGGRSDEDFGVVAFKGGANEFAANLMMKAVTKAKRRVTLSISGLGFLDETEMSGQQRERPETISKEQVEKLRELARELDANMPDYLDFLSDRWDMDIAKVADIPVNRLDDAMAQLERKREAFDKLEAASQRGAAEHDVATTENADG
jgi:hypothetical protein